MTEIRQRTQSDCGLSALGILAADHAARQIDPAMRGLGGLYNKELVKAARLLGLTLRATRKVQAKDLDGATGILRVRWKKGDRQRESPEGHFVALIEGTVVCPIEPVALPWRDYIVKFDAAPATLLKVVA